MNDSSSALKSLPAQKNVGSGDFRLDEIIREIKQKGYSLTPQRYEIIKIIAESKSHPSANDVYNKIKSVYPMISLNTVYKNLSMLSELHQIREIKTLQNAVHFDGDITPHGHFICERCGKIDDFEIKDSIMNGFLKSNIDNKNEREFPKVNGYSIELHGLCGKCAS